jgi:hypothetical protein
MTETVVKEAVSTWSRVFAGKERTQKSTNKFSHISIQSNRRNHTEGSRKARARVAINTFLTAKLEDTRMIFHG